MLNPETNLVPHLYIKFLKQKHGSKFFNNYVVTSFFRCVFLVKRFSEQAQKKGFNRGVWRFPRLSEAFVAVIFEAPLAQFAEVFVAGQHHFESAL